MEAVIIRSNRGEVKEVRRVSVEGGIIDLVKRLAMEALESWDADSDFVVMRDTYTVVLEIPLAEEEFERLKGFNLRRKGSLAVADIPIFGISGKNRCTEQGVEILELVLVAPSISERVDGELVEYAREMTKPS
ncbi:MAG: hypothetical protein DRJ56_04560 [Thermoprotei archaeon]|nr:MAG: hypothetical protein DRJ56_04560 [Thermoprotei archaeon]